MFNDGGQRRKVRGKTSTQISFENLLQKCYLWKWVFVLTSIEMCNILQESWMERGGIWPGGMGGGRYSSFILSVFGKLLVR